MEADFILNLSACERLPLAVQPVANGCKLNPVTAEVRSNDRRLLPRCGGLFLPSYFAPSSHRNSICRPATYICGYGPHAARAARSELNVPFQRSIRAWMLLHAARNARSFLCEESATRLSSSSLPIGP